MLFGEESRKPRDRLARFDTHFVRAPQPAGEILAAELRDDRRRSASGSKQQTPLAHFGLQKRLDHRARFRAARDNDHAALDDFDAGGPGHLQPDVTGSHRPAPHLAAFLAADRDEAEIAHRSAIGLRVAIDDDDAKTTTDGGERMGKTDNAGADNGEVEFFVPAHHCLTSSHACLRAIPIQTTPM